MHFLLLLWLRKFRDRLMLWLHWGDLLVFHMRQEYLPIAFGFFFNFEFLGRYKLFRRRTLPVLFCWLARGLLFLSVARGQTGGCVSLINCHVNIDSRIRIPRQCILRRCVVIVIVLFVLWGRELQLLEIGDVGLRLPPNIIFIVRSWLTTIAFLAHERGHIEIVNMFVLLNHFSYIPVLGRFFDNLSLFSANFVSARKVEPLSWWLLVIFTAEHLVLWLFLPVWKWRLFDTNTLRAGRRRLIDELLMELMHLLLSFRHYILIRYLRADKLIASVGRWWKVLWDILSRLFIIQHHLVVAILDSGMQDNHWDLPPIFDLWVLYQVRNMFLIWALHRRVHQASDIHIDITSISHANLDIATATMATIVKLRCSRWICLYSLERRIFIYKRSHPALKATVVLRFRLFTSHS